MPQASQDYVRESAFTFLNRLVGLKCLEVPAIVDRETWQVAQERRAYNKSQVRRDPQNEYLLVKRVTCGGCGLKTCVHAVTYNGTKYLYYRCPVRHHPRDRVHTCDSPTFRADQVDGAVWKWVKPFLSDPAVLERGLAEYQAGREKETEPLRRHLKAIEDKLAQNQVQLDRLLDLYLNGDVDKGVFVERKNRLETTIAGLERERDALTAQITGQMLTREQIKTLQDFAAEVAEGLDAADADFQARKRIVEALGVEATLAVEDGQRVAYMRCILGDTSLDIVQQRSWRYSP
jgi:site-specific DNA recombinase